MAPSASRRDADSPEETTGLLTAPVQEEEEEEEVSQTTTSSLDQGAGTDNSKPAPPPSIPVSKLAEEKDMISLCRICLVSPWSTCVCMVEYSMLILADICTPCQQCIFTFRI